MVCFTLFLLSHPPYSSESRVRVGLFIKERWTESDGIGAVLIWPSGSVS